MPPVHPEPLLAPVETVRPDHLRQPEERGGVDPVFPRRMLEIPGAAEVVLRPRAADRRPLTVTVEIELDLPLPPPAGAVDTPGEIGSHVMPLAVHAVEQRMHLLIGE